MQNYCSFFILIAKNRHLNVNPAEKRIVFIENPFTPIYFKQILSEILFKKFKVSNI